MFLGVPEPELLVHSLYQGQELLHLSLWQALVLGATPGFVASDGVSPGGALGIIRDWGPDLGLLA